MADMFHKLPLEFLTISPHVSTACVKFILAIKRRIEPQPSKSINSYNPCNIGVVYMVGRGETS